jgi:large subunit ribosomal protein L19
MNKAALFDKIEGEQFRKEAAKFNVGDSVRVHTKVVEGDKERIQIFAGVVIGVRGRGLNQTFTVRRISYGEGVERIFPTHSPRVEKIEVERQGSVRRAKLTYLRDRIGKGEPLAWADLSAQAPRQARSKPVPRMPRVAVGVVTVTWRGSARAIRPVSARKVPRTTDSSIRPSCGASSS